MTSAGYFFRDDFLPMSVVARIRSEALALVAHGQLRPAGVGRDGATDPSVRGDHLCWLDKQTTGQGIRALMRQFEKLRIFVNRELYLGVSRYEMQLAQYRPGSQGYAKHLDAFRGGPNRRLTAIFYLNPVWKPGHGGELALYLPGGELQVQPLQNRVLVFLAEEIEHAVLPVQASRLALTAWFRHS